MASHYIEAMRVRQSEGPYFIGGGSSGGIVALEMAQQLHAQEQQVALLAMVDTPGIEKMPLVKLETDADILAYLLKVLGNISVSVDEVQQLEPDEQLQYFLEEQGKFESPVISPDWEMTQIRHFINLFKVSTQAMLNYKPRVYPGKIIFFHAKEAHPMFAKNPEQNWVDLAADGLEVIDVPGNHITMNALPHVQIIADRLTAALDQ
jgi:thioesterase domain-containing protein